MQFLDDILHDNRDRNVSTRTKRSVGEVFDKVGGALWDLGGKLLELSS